MSRTPRDKPTVIQLSPNETLVIFPPRPDLPALEPCNPSLDEIKQLLKNSPLRKPQGKSRSKRRGKSGTRQASARRRKPIAAPKRRRKPRAE